MNVTRDVIVDLMPLYLAGEGSPATRALVEEYLKSDRELAERLRTLGSRGLEGVVAASPRPESELESLRRARRLIGAMRWLFALGLSLTASALAIEFNFRGGRLVEFHFLMRDAPLLLGTLFVLGLGCLTGYFMLRRGLRITMR
jgi:anti-sigma factor RsiW